MKNADGKLGRMAKWLEEYQRFQIDHIPGEENVDADALSRIHHKINLLVIPDDRDAELEDLTNRRPGDFEETDGRWFFVGDGKRRLWIPRHQRAELLSEL